MKASLLSAAVALLPAALACAGVIPEPFPAARYEKLLADSPFALATATAPVAEPAASWSANLYLGPVWYFVRDGVELENVVVKSRGDVSGSFTLTGHEPGPDGIELVNLQWADDITKTKAVVKKGTEFATLEADQTAAPSAPPVQPPRLNNPLGLPQQRPNGVPQPNAQAQRGNLLNNVGGLLKPANGGAQSAIPRPTSVAPAANALPGAAPYNPNANPNNQSGNDRKRIRVINSK